MLSLVQEVYWSSSVAGAAGVVFEVTCAVVVLSALPLAAFSLAPAESAPGPGPVLPPESAHMLVYALAAILIKFRHLRRDMRKYYLKVVLHKLLQNLWVRLWHERRGHS